MPYYAGYHRSRIEVLQMNRLQLIELIESLRGFFGSDPLDFADESIRQFALNQHEADWTIPEHWVEVHPDAEDDAMMFRVGEDRLLVYITGTGVSWVPKMGRPYAGCSWEVDKGDVETIAMVRSVASGHCRPDILADWVDERYDSAEAVEICRLLRECEQVPIEL